MWQRFNLIPLLLEVSKPTDPGKRQSIIELRAKAMRDIEDAKLQGQFMDLLKELLDKAELRTEFRTSISMAALRGEFSNLTSGIDK